jgi:porin
MGMFGGLFLSDRVNIAGVVSDANADRTKYGQIQEGDLFTAVELQVKVHPLTKRAGYSKLTFWHNDGTKFGEPLNGSTGNDGWGFFIKGEQELTCDGRLIGLLRYGKSYRDSAIYEALAAGHLVLYDPFNTGEFKEKGFNADATGFAYNWIQPTASSSDRDESNFEFFYRFDLFPEMQATLSYQAIVNPAFDPTNNYGSAISFRLRSTW